MYEPESHPPLRAREKETATVQLLLGKSSWGHASPLCFRARHTRAFGFEKTMRRIRVGSVYEGGMNKFCGFCFLFPDFSVVLCTDRFRTIPPSGRSLYHVAAVICHICKLAYEHRQHMRCEGWLVSGSCSQRSTRCKKAELTARLACVGKTVRAQRV